MFYLLGLIIMFLLFGAISQIGNLDPGSELRSGRGISGLVIVLLVAAGLVIHMFLDIWNWRQVGRPCPHWPYAQQPMTRHSARSDQHQQ
jgi:hypothetical protein